MAKLVCFFVVLAVLVNTGLSLNCYHCNKEKIDGCIKSAKPTTQLCSPVIPTQKSVCYYKLSYDTVKKVDVVNASCGQIAAGAALNTFDGCQPTAGITIKECRACDTELCNSSSVFSTSMFALMFLPIMYFITKVALY